MNSILMESAGSRLLYTVCLQWEMEGKKVLT